MPEYSWRPCRKVFTSLQHNVTIRTEYQCFGLDGRAFALPASGMGKEGLNERFEHGECDKTDFRRI